MDIIEERFQQLHTNYKDRGLSELEIRTKVLQHVRTASLRKSASARKQQNKCCKPDAYKILLFLLIPLTVSVFAFIWSYDDPYEILYVTTDFIQHQMCILENNMIVREISRPAFDCEICKNLTIIPIHFDITQEEFTKKYAFTKVPVLIQGESRNWSALDTFSYEYFKRLYDEKSLDLTDEECQFFGYVTEFTSLRDIFEMTYERATFKPGQKSWYIGWSNCDPAVKKQLRMHYSRPSFLPADSESSSLDWIFMGGTGNGAHVHLDHVSMPSWQAQISGSKTWKLFPVPECEAVCHPLQITLKTGDIFVVDTNYWYHSTLVHPGEMSITIGSEYY